MSKQVRVVCLGSNLESRISLEHLIAQSVNVVGLITLPIGESGAVSDYVDLHPLAESAGIPVIDTVDINASATVDALKELRADYLFVLGWSQLLRSEVICAVAGFVVGSHPTPLPQRRGRAPIPWTILEGSTESAVTLFQMSEKVDDGPILIQTPFKIPSRATAMDVYISAAEALSASFVKLYRALCAGDQLGHPQRIEESSYRGKRTPQDGYIDFNKPVSDIDRIVRAVSKPFPGAYFYYHDEKVIAWHSSPYDGPERVGISGQILAKNEKGIVVRVKDGCVVLGDLESGGRQLSNADFKLGETLNYRINDELFELRDRVARLERLVVELKGVESA